MQAKVFVVIKTTPYTTGPVTVCETLELAHAYINSVFSETEMVACREYWDVQEIEFRKEATNAR